MLKISIWSSLKKYKSKDFYSSKNIRIILQKTIHKDQSTDSIYSFTSKPNNNVENKTIITKEEKEPETLRHCMRSPTFDCTLGFNTINHNDRSQTKGNSPRSKKEIMKLFKAPKGKKLKIYGKALEEKYL